MSRSAANNVGGVLYPAAIPRAFIEGWYDGAEFVYVTQDDYHAASGKELNGPKQLLRQLITAPATVQPEFWGMTWHNWPAPAVNATGATGTGDGVVYKTVRSHDYKPSSAANGSTRWRDVEPTNGAYKWDILDLFVNTHYAAGKDIIYTLGFIPDWASSAAAAPDSAYGGKASNPPDNLSDWIDYCTQVATRYLGKIKYYEVWNEQNAGTRWFNGTTAQWVALLKAAHETIKAIDPTAKILIGGVTALDGGNGASWFNTMCGTSDGAAGTGKDWFDIVALHLYMRGNVWTTVPTAVAAIRAHMATHGISSREIWDTESGMIEPYLVTYTTERMVTEIWRRAVLIAGSGVARSVFYDADGGSMGFQWYGPAIKAMREVAEFLTGKTISVINQLPTGQVAAIVGGRPYIL